MGLGLTGPAKGAGKAKGNITRHKEIDGAWVGTSTYGEGAAAKTNLTLELGNSKPTFLSLEKLAWLKKNINALYKLAVED